MLTCQSPTPCKGPSKPRKEIFSDCQSATWLLYKIYYKYLCLWIGSEQHVCLDSVWYLYSQIKNILSYSHTPCVRGHGILVWHIYCAKTSCAKTANLCNSVLFNTHHPLSCAALFICIYLQVFVIGIIIFTIIHMHVLIKEMINIVDSL